MFALASRSVLAMASPTSSGTCEPPGASRKTNPSWSEEKRLRTASMSIMVALIGRSLPAHEYSAPVTLLGRSGIEVSRLILGCGNFGGIGSSPAFFGQGEGPEEAFALMDAAWEAGITTFDTADA